MLKKTLESLLDCKEIQPVHSKGDPSWDFSGKNDAKAEIPVLLPPRAKSWLIGKDSDAGRDWGQKEKWTTEDEMAGWHHGLDGRESEWTLGAGDGQGRPDVQRSMGWQRVGHDWATELNWSELTILDHKPRILMGPILLIWGPKNKIRHLRKRKDRRRQKALEKTWYYRCQNLSTLIFFTLKISINAGTASENSNQFITSR